MFGGLSGQINFFQGKTIPGMIFSGLTFQRKEKTIKVNKKYEQIEQSSYGMFKNGTSGKWYFFFITDYTYINENTTEIKIEIDVEQTYLFDVSLADSFIEREHTSSDYVGDHTVDEGLSIGEIVSNGYEVVDEIEGLTYVLATTVDSQGADVAGGVYTGLYSGLAYYASDDETFITSFIAALAAAGKLEALKNIFVMPKNLIDDFDPDLRVVAPYAKYILKSVSKNLVTLDGYTPKNRKLFCYPYNYLHVSNNQGSDIMLKYEFFSGGACNFTITSDVGPTPTVTMIPLNYRNIAVNNEDLITLGKYPLCNWTGDIYTNWLAQNQVSNAVAVGGSLLGLGVGVATGNPISIGSGVLGVASTIGSFYEKSLEPNQSRGQQSGGGNISAGIQNFSIYKKSINAEHARIIDNYFTKYGYKVNQLKTPNLGSRQRFNYLKTQDCTLLGNVPRDVISKISDNRNNGITFWHTDEIGDYGLPNPIIGEIPPPDPDEPIPPEPVDPYPVNSRGFAWPLQAGVSWDITSPFGPRIHPITGEEDFHNGTDLACSSGTNIRSIRDNGIVAAKGYDASMGNYVYIDFPFKDTTLRMIAMHMLATANVSVGQKVRTGDIIGRVGTTGSSTGPHLHIGIKIKGNFEDPWYFIEPN